MYEPGDMIQTAAVGSSGLSARYADANARGILKSRVSFTAMPSVYRSSRQIALGEALHFSRVECGERVRGAARKTFTAYFATTMSGDQAL